MCKAACRQRAPPCHIQHHYSVLPVLHSDVTTAHTSDSIMHCEVLCATTVHRLDKSIAANSTILAAAVQLHMAVRLQRL
jgi:hypothetical protein